MCRERQWTLYLSLGEGSGAQVWQGETEGAGKCLPWKNGGSGMTLSLPTIPWQEGELASPHRQEVKGQEDIASSCTRWGSGWTTGRISSQKGSGTGRSCPERWWSPQLWMQPLELCSSCHCCVQLVKLLLLASRMGFKLYWAEFLIPVYKGVSVLQSSVPFLAT